MNDDVEILHHETLYRGFLGIERYRLRHRLFAGGWSPELGRELVAGYQASTVLPYDPVRDEVVLIEQFRVGALKDPRGAWPLEIVGGIIDGDETPEAVARRETLEETGCAALELVKAADYLVSPGYTTERIHFFCGRVDAAGAGGIHGLPHEGEDIRVRVFPARDALEMLERGEIVASSTLIALQWFAVHRERLRLLWKPPSPPLGQAPASRPD